MLVNLGFGYGSFGHDGLLYGLLGAIDHQYLDGSSGGFQFQSNLLLNRGESRRGGACGIGVERREVDIEIEFLGDRFVSLTLIPEGMAFMQTEIRFR